MASPQLEQGFIRIATKLWEALYGIRIPGEARRVLDFIIRKTYGFHKKRDKISLSQFVKALGSRRHRVCELLNMLESMNLIIVTKTGLVGKEEVNEYGLNKDYETWKPLPTIKRGDGLKKGGSTKKGTRYQKRCEEGTKKGTSSIVPKKVHTKDTLLKDTFTKDNSIPSVSSQNSETQPKLDFELFVFTEGSDKQVLRITFSSVKKFKEMLNEIYSTQLKPISINWRDLQNSEKDNAALVWLLQQPKIGTWNVEDGMEFLKKVHEDKKNRIYTHPYIPVIHSFVQFKEKYDALWDYNRGLRDNTAYQRALRTEQHRKEEELDAEIQRAEDNLY